MQSYSGAAFDQKPTTKILIYRVDLIIVNSIVATRDIQEIFPLETDLISYRVHSINSVQAETQLHKDALKSSDVSLLDLR